MAFNTQTVKLITGAVKEHYTDLIQFWGCCAWVGPFPKGVEVPDPPYK